MTEPALEAVIEERRRFSTVWLIPLVAVFIAGWLVFKAVSEQGPTITIVLSSAEGLEAKKTKIKFKNVELGQVEKITLNDDLSKVIVSAKLVKGTEKYLTDKTRFWITRARVAAGEVSGIGTLLSGAYIGIDPVETGVKTDQFIGLEQPPSVTTGDAGRHFSLRAKSLGSLDIGSPVFFRKIKVGQVVAYSLDADGEAVSIQVFVKSPHDQRVFSNTRFWNAGGVDVSINADGVKINTESIVTLLIGGIAFDVPTKEFKGAIAKADQSFVLLESREQINDRIIQDTQRWVVFFDGSVRGLKAGAPVEFRGIKIGEVVDIRMEYNAEDSEIYIPVVIETEPERISASSNSTKQSQHAIMDEFVKRGLRAQLRTGNILTGQLLVEFSLNDNATAATIDWENLPYPRFPSTPQTMDEIASNLTSILTKFQQIPLDKIGHDLAETLRGTNQLVNAPEIQRSLVRLESSLASLESTLKGLDNTISPQMLSTIAHANKILNAAENLIGEQSPLNNELKDLLKELAEAARSFRQMADYLERHPEALVKGKTGQ